MLGVNDSGPNETPAFFLDVNPNDTFVQVTNVTASGSVSGNIAIGELANVTVGGMASLDISSATLTFTQSNQTIVAAVGNINGLGAVEAATLGAQVPPLPSITWGANFQDSINGSTFGSPQFQLNEPSAGSILSALGSQILGSLGNFSLLGSLGPTLENPLPLINESIAQLTGLDAYLPKLPSLGSLGLGSLDPGNAIGRARKAWESRLTMATPVPLPSRRWSTTC